MTRDRLFIKKKKVQENLNSEKKVTIPYMKTIKTTYKRNGDDPIQFEVQ